MKSTQTLISVLLVMSSTIASAFTIEFDPCAAYKLDPRGYQECRVHLKKEEASSKDFKTYLCLNVGSVASYIVDVKEESGVYKIRQSSHAPWQTVTSDVLVNGDKLAVIPIDPSGVSQVEVTCTLKK